jgi:hypothetical protein
MIIKTATCLVFAGACLTVLAAMPVTHSEAAGVSSGWSAQRNVIQSERYDRLLETNRSFRHARMRKECGPITDRQLRADCLASFSQDEPYVGSSTPPRHYRSSAGR